MADVNIRAVITAKDEASSVVRGFNSGLKDSSDGALNLKNNFLVTAAALAGLSYAANQAFTSIIGGINQAIEASIRQQNALIGLTSISKAFGQSSDQATEAAKRLASDGLMTVGEAATGLKNLLAAGFNLPQAITLMNRFKDSAAFNRQAALGFGQAIAGATEGIKNGNSILVDNAGVTKNLSVILQEAGYSAQDLMKATTDAGVRQAIFNGILKETAPMLGDAARLSETFAGKQSALNVQIENAKARIGEALQPALLKLIEVLKPIVEWIARFAEKNPQLVATIIIVGTVLTGLAVVITAVAAAITFISGALAAFGTTIGAVAAAALPVIGIVLAIGAAIGLIAYLVITHWNTIKNAFGVAIDWIAAKVDYMKNHFWETVGFIIGFFATLPIKIPILIGGLIVKIVSMIASINWGAVWSGLWNTVTGLWRNIWNGFQGLINNIIHANWGAIGRSIGNGIIGLLEGAINGALRGLPGAKSIRLPRFAEGVQNFGGGLAVVGERGPELVNLPSGSDVIPNHALGGTINVSVNVGVYAGTEIEKRRVAQELFSALQDVANSRNTTVANMLGGV